MPVLKMLGFILKPLLRPTYLSITKIITVFLKVSKTLSQGHDTEPALEGWTIHYFMKLNLTSAEVLDLNSQTLQESFASSLLCYLKFCLTNLKTIKFTPNTGICRGKANVTVNFSNRSAVTAPSAHLPKTTGRRLRTTQLGSQAFCVTWPNINKTTLELLENIPVTELLWLFFQIFLLLGM